MTLKRSAESKKSMACASFLAASGLEGARELNKEIVYKLDPMYSDKPNHRRVVKKSRSKYSPVEEDNKRGR